MGTEQEYTITELASIAGVTPRTVRYYISLGLLPPPGQVGPGTRYGDGHLQRVRLIGRLQAQHLPLAEIRGRIEGLDDAAVMNALDADLAPPSGSALDYIRSVRMPAHRLAEMPALMAAAAPQAPMAAAAMSAPMPPSAMPRTAALPPPASSSEPPEPSAKADPAGPARSQWERIGLSPNVELHIRRPLGRLENKRVERLITVARELLQEDQP
jgi:DNA-binding transcriptional MerR regulator